MQESFWWWHCSDRKIISLFPHLHTPSHFSTSLISLIVSVDVKHHVYQRVSRKATNLLRSLPDNMCFFPAWQWEDFPNYNRGMDKYFSCFLDDIKVFKPSEERDSTVQVTVRCYRWYTRQKLHIEFRLIWTPQDRNSPKIHHHVLPT